MFGEALQGRLRADVAGRSLRPGGAMQRGRSVRLFGRSIGRWVIDSAATTRSVRQSVARLVGRSLIPPRPIGRSLRDSVDRLVGHSLLPPQPSVFSSVSSSVGSSVSDSAASNSLVGVVVTQSVERSVGNWLRRYQASLESVVCFFRTAGAWFICLLLAGSLFLFPSCGFDSDVVFLYVTVDAESDCGACF